ncbi:MAG: efflux RND transporter periplasmic adaptor subunit [Burkholderiales bacterium]|jgi:HlyD family secretion protein
MSSASSRSSGSRRALIAIIATAVAAAGGAFYMSRPAANTAPAASTAGPQDIVARGRIEPLGRVIAVNAPADTPVTVLQKLLVDQGSKVKAGQELALADDYDVRKSDLAVQKHNLTLAESQLAQVMAGAKGAEIAAQSNVIAARKAQLFQAQSQWDRSSKLFNSGFYSKDALDALRANLDQAKSGVAQAEDVLKSLTEVRRADENVALAQVAVAKAAVARAEAALERTVIRAPISGTVLSIQAREGEAISPDGILRMADLTHLIVVAEIDESQAGRIAQGASAKIDGSMLPKPVQASVSRIAHEVFRQKRPTSDILIGRDARIVEVELTPQTPLPTVVGGEVTVRLVAAQKG